MFGFSVSSSRVEVSDAIHSPYDFVPKPKPYNPLGERADEEECDRLHGDYLMLLHGNHGNVAFGIERDLSFSSLNRRWSGEGRRKWRSFRRSAGITQSAVTQSTDRAHTDGRDEGDTGRSEER